METTELLQMLVEIGGIAFLLITFLFYAKRKLTEEIGLLWILFSILIVVIGAIPDSFAFVGSIRKGTAVALFCGAFIFLLILLYLSIVISSLLRRNQELAIQVTLLLHDNERIRSAMEEDKQGIYLKEPSTQKGTEENSDGIGTEKRASRDYANV